MILIQLRKFVKQCYGTLQQHIGSIRYLCLYSTTIEDVFAAATQKSRNS